MIEKRGTLRLPVNGEEIAVPSSTHLSCPKCGELLLRVQDSKRLGEDAIARYRKKHNLLSADEIHAIRDHFSLTQAELARLLRLGANTVSLGIRPERADRSDGYAPPADPRSAGQHRVPARPRA